MNRGSPALTGSPARAINSRRWRSASNAITGQMAWRPLASTSLGSQETSSWPTVTRSPGATCSANPSPCNSTVLSPKCTKTAREKLWLSRSDSSALVVITNACACSDVTTPETGATAVISPSKGPAGGLTAIPGPTKRSENTGSGTSSIEVTTPGTGALTVRVTAARSFLQRDHRPLDQQQPERSGQSEQHRTHHYSLAAHRQPSWDRQPGHAAG